MLVRFRQDVVLVLRSPEVEEFDKLRAGAILIAMIHFRTRPRRIANLSPHENRRARSRKWKTCIRTEEVIC